MYIWKKFKDLTVNRKTFIFSFSVFLIIGFASTFDLLTFFKISDKSQHLSLHVEFLDKMNTLSWATVDYAQAHFEYADELTDEKKNKFIQKSTQIELAVSSLRDFVINVMQKRHGEEVSISVDGLSLVEFLDKGKETLDDTTKRTLQTGNKEELKIIHKKLHPSTFEIIYGLKKVNNQIGDQRFKLIQDIEGLKGSAIRRLIFLYFGVLFGMLILRILIHITINKPVIDLEKVVSQSSFSSHLRAKDDTKDEVGNMGKSFNKLMRDLRKTYRDLGNQAEKFLAVVENIADGVIVLDKEFNIIIFNPVAEKITGFEKDNALGRKLSEVLVFTDKESLNNSGKHSVSSSGNYREIIQKSGKKVIIKGKAKKLMVGNEEAGSVLVFADTTKEKEINDAKSEFVSITSHQLNTPLTSVGWSLEVLESGKFGELNEKQKSIVSTAYGSNRRMKELVSSLLDISRIEAGRLQLKSEKVNVSDLVSLVVKEISPLIEAKKQKIKLDFVAGLMVNADEIYLKQVIQNFISNASKYSADEKEIKILIKAIEDDVVVSVEDLGRGIPENEKKKLFEKFYRASNSGENEGNGLGLYINREIINIFKGKIWFESTENKGSTFSISLPLLKNT